ncbi:phenylalanine--tRNA ligase-like protein [Dinothrombium tinctorium]|uniref:phenylalanine--tRNA ligase n=1 Tax=Dinothrombium tinctorium TaxID=1965070 RepID=A0A3S3PL84_9ACAR|nr:phenylalanine--tRNA ligase-like protein [Dinothrombium tinctorium]
MAPFLFARVVSVRTVRALRFSTKASRRFEFDSFDICGQRYKTDLHTNITQFIVALTDRKLYKAASNPIRLISDSIRHYFKQFDLFEYPSPVVSLDANFDSLLIGKDHVARKPSDTYYVNEQFVLRTHTSAHQSDCLQQGSQAFICIADVYRRDAIKRTHFPCFHQCEVFKLFSSEELNIKSILAYQENVRSDQCQESYTIEASKSVENDLKYTIEQYIKELLGKQTQTRWVSAYFPFTHPSWELEIMHNGEWLEILGCGIVENRILTNNRINDKIGWAAGFGLERLAMLKYSIPDIRLFWSKDTGFLSQFKNLTHADNMKYTPISKYPQCIKDISFWIPDEDTFCEQDFLEIIHSQGRGLIEQVDLIDKYTNKKGRTSLCYRIIYRSHERNLTNAEVNEIHCNIGIQTELLLNVEVRE